MQKKIVHYIFRDVFSVGYINFMVEKMCEYQHLFLMKRTAKQFKHGIYQRKKDDLSRVNESAEIIFLDHEEDIFYNQDIQERIIACDQIIISGLFDSLKYVYMYDDKVWEKIYLHFWGGDFYCYRENGLPLSEERMRKKDLLLRGIERCAGILNVIQEDYDKLTSILNIKKQHLEAPMPEAEGDMQGFFGHLLPAGSNSSKKRIVIGNSAAEENCHIEIFERLSWLKNINTEIVCPLSYGRQDYRERVITKGHEIFGNQFIPILEFMSFKEYVDFLNTCDVGIYNNNRQQGFKNISIMLGLEKKVYLRKDTAIWDKLKKMQIKVHDIEELDKKDYEELFAIKAKDANNNHLRIASFFETYRYKWSLVFDENARKRHLKRCADPIPLSIHLVDHCNLNCCGCSHYAPVAEESYLGISELKDTLEKIHKSGIFFFETLALMGGEPLLHSNIVEIMKITREYLPGTTIKIVTNGILLPQMKEAFWESCRKLKIKIEVTFYPLDMDYEKLLKYVQGQGVECDLYVDRRDGKFRKDTLEEDGANNPYDNYARCKIGGLFPQVKNGRLFRCSQAANIEIINKAFNTAFQIDETDYLELSEIKDENDVREFLVSPSRFCRYCNLSKQHFNNKWKRSNKSKDEWF